MLGVQSGNEIKTSRPLQDSARAHAKTGQDLHVLKHVHMVKLS